MAVLMGPFRYKQFIQCWGTMKKTLLFSVLLLCLCACTKSKPSATLPVDCGCIALGTDILKEQGSDQTLHNPKLAEEYNALLKKGLEDAGLRVCGEGENSGYMVRSSEFLWDYSSGGMTPGVGTAFPIIDVITSGTLYVISKATSDRAKAYTLQIPSDREVRYFVWLLNLDQSGTKAIASTTLVEDKRPHFVPENDEQRAAVKKIAAQHYAAQAAQVVSEMLRIRNQGGQAGTAAP